MSNSDKRDGGSRYGEDDQVVSHFEMSRLR